MTATLQAKKRTTEKHSNLTKLRNEGEIPGIVYGSKVENTAISLNEANFLKTIREVGRNGVISLDIDGETYNVVLNEYDSDPIKRGIVHVDFLAVDLSKAISAPVRVSLVGEAAGVKDGGVMQQALHELTVTAKPNDIPTSIDIDVTDLQVGDTITVGDVKGYDKIEINHEQEEVIASILAPRQEEEISTGEQQEEGMPDNVEGRETKPDTAEE
ncbi:50S ribosomal protein L25/general stress protein Ctc [Cytobacillus oceanisediminis]|uniref:Large ribosomal subunit protein bL25 n=2 Tax=Niallia TaxID=2837506 RepID=A0A941GI75_NIACI|nr:MULTISPECIES: 50S ribosomal protein L25/general stress protein Ctc [Bacillaceae]MDU1847327.1 50S ribosomal protein L25/general stress protein Ctc [Niallia nealsonii]MBZ9535610.1 50S ribosomal protein L25/general stress protein Ctc [Cytobacillus oceanisediminis]MCB5239487.1 50S ribosomal protein L25/general stress protein Ctc [Niallia circulans]MED3794758.1 50S ribosomal protein L25/general stress protein Ctc [Niallia alba]NMO75514.1 50S ribosomal protein L25/general stress protein Ctc [Nial